MKGSRLIATVTVLLIALGCLMFTPMTWAEGPFDVDRTTSDEGRTDCTGDQSFGTGDGPEDGVFHSADSPSQWWYMGLSLRLSIQFFFDNLNIANETTHAMQRVNEQESGADHAFERR